MSAHRFSAPTSRLVALSLLALSLCAPIAAIAAGGDEKKPAPAASASAAPAAAKPGKPDDKAKDAGPGPLDASAGNTLPPGHPPLDEGLPEGHPHVDGEEEEAPQNPHAGAQDPHQQNRARGRGQNQFFEPPEDLIAEDPALPAGTLVLSIRDADEKPVPNASVVIGILKSSVAQGDSRDRKALDVDAEGNAKLDGLPVGQGTSYRVSSTQGPATYATMPFALSDKVGKRVTLHVYKASNNIEDVLVGAQAFVFVSLREDSLSIESLFNIFNIGRVSWVPTPGAASVGLPEGYKAFNKPDQMGDVMFVEVKSKASADLQGTIAPGRHEASFRYQVPLEGSERQSFHIELPPHVGEARVFAEAGKSMRLEVAGFPDAQKQRGRDGRNTLVTVKQVDPGERGLKSLDITIGGLPTHGPGRWIAVAIALLSLGMTMSFVVQQKRSGIIPDEAKDDLLEAREALLNELVALEKAKRKGDVGPKTYDRAHKGLLDALARIESRLDEIRTQRAEAKKAKRAEQAARKPRPSGEAS